MSYRYEQFENVEDVWFWFCGSMAAKMEGGRACGDYASVERCCEVSDIYRIVRKMKLLKQITNRHLRVMLKLGNRDCDCVKRSDLRLWDEGMAALAPHLRGKGII